MTLFIKLLNVRWRRAGVILLISTVMNLCRSTSVLGLFRYTFPFNSFQSQISYCDRSGEREDHNPVEIIRSANISWRKFIVPRQVCALAPSCWKKENLISSSVNCSINGSRMRFRYRASLIVWSRRKKLDLQSSSWRPHTKHLISHWMELFLETHGGCP